MTAREETHPWPADWSTIALGTVAGCHARPRSARKRRPAVRTARRRCRRRDAARRGPVLDDASVGEDDDPLGAPNRGEAVRHHEAVSAGVRQQLVEQATSARTSRLAVGSSSTSTRPPTCAAIQRAGQCDALPLATGELRRRRCTRRDRIVSQPCGSPSTTGRRRPPPRRPRDVVAVGLLRRRARCSRRPRARSGRSPGRSPRAAAASAGLEVGQLGAVDEDRPRSGGRTRRAA